MSLINVLRHFSEIHSRAELLEPSLRAYVPIRSGTRTRGGRRAESAGKGAELQSEAIIEEHGQRRLARLAKPFKQLEVPVFAGRQFSSMETAETFENILEARVELRQESRRRRFLPDGRFAAGDVMHQRS